MNIAIDGPAGAGKSTIAKIVAARLKYIYVDTGAMYRAFAYHALNECVNLDDPEAIAAIAPGTDISIRYVNGEQRVYLNGEDINDHLRTEQVGNTASIVAKVPAVRRSLTELQRKLARENDVVMDGRDIGSSVLPDAEVKIYLTASVEVRAKRRYDELKAKGENPDIDVIAKDIADRDYSDMHRDISPLIQCDDATLIDSSDMTIEEVAAAIMKLVPQT